MKKSLIVTSSICTIVGAAFLFGVFNPADADQTKVPEPKYIQEKDRTKKVTLDQANSDLDFKLYVPTIIPEGLELKQVINYYPPSVVTDEKERKKLTRARLYFTNKEENKLIVIEQTKQKMEPGDAKNIKKTKVDDLDVSSYDCECGNGTEQKTYYFKKGSITIFVDAVGVKEEELLPMIKSLKND